MAESKIVIYGALAANGAIAVTKFVVAAITGSSAMLSEGIHSLVDASNGVLLLVGLERSKRPPSAAHPYGHGKELYFWSLIVAVLIFGVGGGVSFYEGVMHMRNPEPLQDPMWNYIVLGAAFLFEGGSFAVAWRQFSKQRGSTPLWTALRQSKDPANYTVLAEDSAALAGLLVAAAGVYLSHRLQMPVLDGAASVLIGLLLASVAVLLIRESRGLLIGEGVLPETARAIRAMVREEPAVREVGPLLSMYIGADEVLVTLVATFDPNTALRDVADAIERIEQRIRSRFPKIRRIYCEAVNVGNPRANAPSLRAGAAHGR